MWYDGTHSITFGEKNTWTDWHLIPSSRPVVATSSQKTSYQDLPGENGSLDLSDYLSGDPIFGNREGSFEFVVDHDKWDDWENARFQIANYLRGKEMRMVLMDDPLWYYSGRFAMENWRNGQNYSLVNIKYTVRPFKYRIEARDELKNISVKDLKTVTVEGSVACESPTFIVSNAGQDGLFLSCDEGWFNLPNGETKITDLKLRPGAHILSFHGTGTITIDYHEGCL